MEMPFGRYKGTEISDLALSYLRWLLSQAWLSTSLRSAAHVEVTKREWVWREAFRAQTGPPPFEPGSFWYGIQ